MGLLDESVGEYISDLGGGENFSNQTSKAYKSLNISSIHIGFSSPLSPLGQPFSSAKRFFCEGQKWKNISFPSFLFSFPVSQNDSIFFSRFLLCPAQGWVI